MVKQRKIYILQPALPEYRISFFEKIYTAVCSKYEFKVFYSQSDLGSLQRDKLNYVWAENIGVTKRLGKYFFWQHIRSLLRLKTGDILVIFGNPRFLSNIILFMFAKLYRVKIVWWTHLRSSTSTNYGTYIRSLFMRCSEAVLFYTDEEANKFNQTNVRAGAYALNNGLDHNYIDKFVEPYKLSERNVDLVFIGRLTPKSNFSLLIEAVSKLRRKNITLNVIGNMKGDEAYVADLLGQYKVEKSVYFHGQIVDEAEISKIMNGSRIFVYPGAVGLSVIHALNYGLPTIVHDSDIHHMPEISALSYTETGERFERGNADRPWTCTIAGWNRKISCIP